MKRIRNWIMAVAMVFTFGGSIGSIALTQNTSADVACDQAFLTFPTWYRGLTTDDGKCNILSPDSTNDKDALSKFIWKIALNSIEIGLQIVGYISSGLILFGGFKFITSSGEAEGIKAAKSTITNAAIGLVISIVSVAVIKLIVGLVG